jgi:hypothetical protein
MKTQRRDEVALDIRSSEFSSTTTRPSQIAGEAPLPYPVPKRGAKVVLEYCADEIP